jgi:LETM1 and EF-hand domain-containing protein 1
MYNPSSLQEVKDELEAESVRGLMDKTKDMLRQVVEEKKVLSRDENAKLETELKQQQQQQQQNK